MPSSVVKELMQEVTELKVAIASIKTDIDALKKLVYIGVGVGTTASAGVLVQLLTHTLGK